MNENNNDWNTTWLEKLNEERTRHIKRQTLYTISYHQFALLKLFPVFTDFIDHFTGLLDPFWSKNYYNAGKYLQNKNGYPRWGEKKPPPRDRLFRADKPRNSNRTWQMPLNVNIPHRREDDRMATMRDCLAWCYFHIVLIHLFDHVRALYLNNSIHRLRIHAILPSIAITTMTIQQYANHLGMTSSAFPSM